MSDIKLPPLPEPDILSHIVTVWRDEVECEIDKGPRYTSEQMQAYARAAIEAQRAPDGWRPIETAPKDGTRVLLYWPMFCNGPHEEFGRWDTEPYKNKPSPYWAGDQEPVYGIRKYRTTPPTHWMPRPPPPNTTDDRL